MTDKRGFGKRSWLVRSSGMMSLAVAVLAIGAAPAIASGTVSRHRAGPAGPRSFRRRPRMA